MITELCTLFVTQTHIAHVQIVQLLEQGGIMTLDGRIHQEGLYEEDIRKYVENQERQQATLQQCVSIHK